MARQKGTTNRPKEVIEAEKAEKARLKAEREAAKAAGTAVPKAPKKAAAAKGTPGPGHNSALNDDERKALHLVHVGEYLQGKTQFDEASANMKNIGKRIKKEGGSVAQIKRTLKLRTPAGIAEVKADLAEIIECAAWEGVGLQLELGFAPSIDPADEEARAFQAGKTAGMEAKDCKPPYDAGTPAGQRWIDGWHEGQAINGSKIGQKSDQPAADAAAEAFSDAVPDRQPTAEEIAAGRQDWKDKMSENIRTGDQVGRPANGSAEGAKFDEEAPGFLDRKQEQAPVTA